MIPKNNEGCGFSATFDAEPVEHIAIIGGVIYKGGTPQTGSAPMRAVVLKAVFAASTGHLIAIEPPVYEPKEIIPYHKQPKFVNNGKRKRNPNRWR